MLALTLTDDSDPVYSTQDIRESAVALITARDTTSGEIDSRVKLKIVWLLLNDSISGEP